MIETSFRKEAQEAMELARDVITLVEKRTKKAEPKKPNK
jgi:hypothetical protein